MANPQHLQAAASQFPQYHFARSRITASSLQSPSYLTLLAAYPLPAPASECLSSSRPLDPVLRRESCAHRLLAAVSSEPSIKLYSYAPGAEGRVPALDHFAELRGHSRTIYDIKFHNVHGSFDTAQVETASGAAMLSSCSADGTVKMWDVRQQQAVSTFKHPKGKPFFSCASAGNLLVGGSGPFVYLWDLRSSRLLAENEEFHTEDINQIAFHPLDPSTFYTGSEDGLVCVIKPEGADQDEWLLNVLNTENPLSRFGFFGPQAEYLWALSCVETLSLWHVENCERISDFAQIRDHLSVAAHMTIDYLIDAHYDQRSQRVFLATGCNSGELVLSHVNKAEIQPFCLAHVKNKPPRRNVDGSASSAAPQLGAAAPAVSPVTGFAIDPLPSDSPFALASLQATAPASNADGDESMDEADEEAAREFLKHGEVVIGEGGAMQDAGEEEPFVTQPIDANDEGHTATIRDVLWFDGVLITGGEDSRLCVWTTDAAVADAPSASASLKSKQHDGPTSPNAGPMANTKSARQFKPY